MESKQAFLTSAKAALVKAVTEDRSAEAIMSEALSVAKAEGSWEAAAMLANAVGEGATKEEAAAYLMGIILNGPQDTWSGRGNEGRRARFEGMLAVAQKYQRGY